MILRPRSSTLFPYTTLFRSVHQAQRGGRDDRLLERHVRVPHGDIQIAIGDRKSTRLNSSHGSISYAVFCLKKKNCSAKKIISPDLAHSIICCVAIDECFHTL